MNRIDRTKLFSTALSSLMQECGVNQVELSKRSGIVVSRLNNYLKGKYRTVKPAHLAAIYKGMDGTPSSRAALGQAYLYDLLPENLRGLLDIRVEGARETGRWEVPSKDLPASFAAAFRELYIHCVSSAKARERTSVWISMMKETAGHR